MAKELGETTYSLRGWWKSVKYEEVYLRAYETVGEARSSIGRYLDFLQRATTAFES